MTKNMSSVELIRRIDFKIGENITPAYVDDASSIDDQGFFNFIKRIDAEDLERKKDFSRRFLRKEKES